MKIRINSDWCGPMYKGQTVEAVVSPNGKRAVFFDHRDEFVVLGDANFSVVQESNSSNVTSALENLLLCGGQDIKSIEFFPKKEGVV